MLPAELFAPSSIAVIGASDDVHKPGGKVLANLLAGSFEGPIYPVNSKAGATIQGLPAFREAVFIPSVDVAIVAVPAASALRVVREMENTRNFIILSAGFSETGTVGAGLERALIDTINHRQGCLIGPNSIGLMNARYHGVFTEPVPQFHPDGCHLISGSGATACFIMELAIPRGVRFSGVVSVGNSAQTGVEDVLAHIDDNFDNPGPRLVLLYMERIDKPEKLLRHAHSLFSKGCRIAAIKSGSSDAGSRAAVSHTGAMANPDDFVDALFQKAGIIRCDGRRELVDVACALQTHSRKSQRVAVITHAGGPGVMLTDALAKNGLDTPKLQGPRFEELLKRLYPGSSVTNPIDFLATGTPEQLSQIIDTVNETPDVDSLAVIFGTPGLVDVHDAYRVIDKRSREGPKPIFAVLPSTLTAHRRVAEFIALGNTYFPDETALAHALGRIARTPMPTSRTPREKRRHRFTRAGWLDTEHTAKLLSEFDIAIADYAVVDNADTALSGARRIGYPVALKADGVLHKSDNGALALDIRSDHEVLAAFDRLSRKTGRVVVQKMTEGIELFCGAVYEPRFGHLVSVGLGGIFVEHLHDIRSALAPLTLDEATDMIRGLRGRSVLAGVRGRHAVNEAALAALIVRVASLVSSCDRVLELDLNPIMARSDRLIVVDARVRVVDSRGLDQQAPLDS